MGVSRSSLGHVLEDYKNTMCIDVHVYKYIYIYIYIDIGKKKYKT